MAQNSNSATVAMATGNSASKHADLALDRLESLTASQIRAEWRRLYKVAAPRCLSRDLLVRGIAYKVQERAYGGLSQSTRRRLETLARALKEDGEGAFDPGLSLKPGAKLTREWHGKTHTVAVLEDGFAYRDERFRSLSQIARVITGAHWSGPRFFGIGRAAEGASASKKPTNG